MSEYVIISIPEEVSRHFTLDYLNRWIRKSSELHDSFAFEIPDLGVKAIDGLFRLTDRISHINFQVEQAVRKLYASYHELLGEAVIQPNSAFESKATVIPDPKNVDGFLASFHWCENKYPIQHSIFDNLDKIEKNTNLTIENLREKLSDYTNLKNAIQNIEKKTIGSLMFRNFAEDLKLENGIVSSDYLTTQFVVVPTTDIGKWNKKYQTLHEFVIPQTSKMLISEKDYTLMSVVMFRRAVEEFRVKAREHKFFVRDCDYDPDESAKRKLDFQQLKEDRKEMLSCVLLWTKYQFSECFVDWVHLKAAKVYVESMLMYGLGTKFVPVLLKPQKKSSKKVINSLMHHYKHLNCSLFRSKSSRSEVDSTASFGVATNLAFDQPEVCPFVFQKINTNFSDK